jgi:hypothetical protein
MVNVHTSRLARWAARWLTRGSGERPSLKQTLADLIPGQSAQVVGFSPGLSLKQQAHLLATGLPGRSVQVLQHNPVTVVQVEHRAGLETDLPRMFTFPGSKLRDWSTTNKDLRNKNFFIPSLRDPDDNPHVTRAGSFLPWYQGFLLRRNDNLLPLIH